MRRYVAVVDFYIYAENDDEAKGFLFDAIEDIKYKVADASQVKCIEFVEQPTGTLGNRKIDLTD